MNPKISKFPSPFVSFGIRYGTAILLVGLALGINLLLWVFVKPVASPLFLVAIMVTAWKRGLQPGIFATLISGFVIDLVFLTPQYQLGGSFDDLFRLGVFFVEGVVLCRLITWRVAAGEEIQNSREQLQALSLRQQALLEDERKRISLEIHDELGQALTGLKMDLHFLGQQIKKTDGAEKSIEIDEKIKDLMSYTDTAILTVRRIATELRPPILDDLGLVAAIEWQSQEFQRRTGIPCVLSTNVDSIELNSDFSTAVFRIFQETLTNIIRHAEANKIVVDLKKSDQKLVLRVEDNGKGIEVDSAKGNNSLGLLGMHERARMAGGELKIFGGAQGGTVILLAAPIQ